MSDHATPSQRVVGSTPTRRTNLCRPQACWPAAGALSYDQSTGLVNRNLERGVPWSVVGPHVRITQASDPPPPLTPAYCREICPLGEVPRCSRTVIQ